MKPDKVRVEASRRQWLHNAGMLSLAGLAGCAPEKIADQTSEPSARESANAEQPASEPITSGREALEQLIAGNARFVEGKTRHAHESASWRKHLVGSQHPHTVVIGCSDSRVPPELVFDQGFGEVFTIRVAGNIIADDVLGSIQYARVHLKTPLIVVMGHGGCGAVTAAVEYKRGQAKEPPFITKLIERIEPGLAKLDLDMPLEQLIAEAVKLNVRSSVEQISSYPAAKASLDRGDVLVVGAIYDLATGSVEFLDS